MGVGQEMPSLFPHRQNARKQPEAQSYGSPARADSRSAKAKAKAKAEAKAKANAKSGHGAVAKAIDDPDAEGSELSPKTVSPLDY